MSTSITKFDCQIVIYHQHEMLSKIDYWVVEVWQDFDRLKPEGNEKVGKAQQLFGIDNMDWNNKYQLTDDTLESMVAKALDFIKQTTKEK